MQQGGSDHHHRSLLRSALRGVTGLTTRSPRVTLALMFLLAAAAIGWTVWKIEFKTKRADLIDPQAEFHQRWVEYTESFGDATDIVVVVEADRPETVRKVLDDLGPRVTHTSDLFTEVLYRIDARKLREKGLQYLSPQQLEALIVRLDEFNPVLNGRWELVELQSVVSRLRYQIETAHARPEALGPLLEHADVLTASLDDYIHDPTLFHSPWPNLATRDRRLQEVLRPDFYLINKRGTMGLLKARPVFDKADFTGPSRSIKRLKELIADVAPAHPDARISVTGIPILEHDEMERSQSDMLRASLISFAGVGLLLFVGFRGFRHPALALLMLGVAMAWAFGYTTLAVGHLNILSVSFAVILIGLGIDFAIHYLARYLQHRRDGEDLKPALLETSAGVGPGIAAAAITTALAFFCATLTDFRGVAELGIIAAGGILLCALATFLVLPPLVAWSDRNMNPENMPRQFDGGFLRSLTSRRPMLVMLVCFTLVAAMGTQAVQMEDGHISPRIRYDYNLLNLQAEGVEAVEAQQRIFEKSDDSLLFAVSLANSPQEARHLHKQFKALPSVHRVEDLGSRLPAWPHQQTSPLIRTIGSRLSRLPREVPMLTRANPQSVGSALEQLYQLVRKNQDPAEARIAQSIDHFLDKFERLSLAQQSQFLGDFQYRMTASLLQQLHALAGAASPERLTYADIPHELSSRFVSPEGKWLLQIYPKDEIWDAQPLEEFVQDVRSVDPNATGTPLQNYEASKQIIESYESAAVYALVMIGLVLLVDFTARDRKLLILLPPLAVILFAVLTLEMKISEINPVLVAAVYIGLAGAIAAIIDSDNLRDVFLTLIPPIGGAIMMFGILGLLKVDLNPANLIVLPLILGIGVDDGVHVVHDFRSREGEYETSPSTLTAVVLTSLTSIIGFGSMMIAAHRGLYSVGLVMVIGVGSCLFMSVVMLPAILAVVASSPRARQRSGKSQSSGDSKSVKSRAA